MNELFEKLKKYNYWENQSIKTGYFRREYLSKIKKYQGNNLIKVLLGQRRVGKSYLLRQIMSELLKNKVKAKNIFYLNKELVDFDEIKNYKDLAKLVSFYEEKLKVKGKIYIFLDEIQEISGWEKIVNSFSQDYAKEYEVFITGSNSKMLSGELATYLSGRYIPFEIFPFSFKEYTGFYKLPQNKEHFLEYLKSGGLPELFNLTDQETKKNYLASLRDTILFRDIVQRYKIKDADLLEKVFLYLTDNIGNLFSINSLVNYLKSNKIKTNYETISNYVSYILNTFVIHEAQRFDIKGKNIFSGARKFYLNDLSFKNYLSSSFDWGNGKHLENLVYLHYRSRGYSVYVGLIDQNEVDLVVEKEKEKKYIQVAYSLDSKKVIEREFGPLEKIKDSYEKMVVTLDDISLGNKEGIKHIKAWEL